MAGNRKFKKLINRSTRLSFYIERNRVKRLGWKPKDKLLMKIGPDGEAYITKLDGIPITLIHNITTDQYFVTFPSKRYFLKEKRMVRITEHDDGLVINFF